MDTLTHMALGAAVAETTCGRKIGNKAMLVGAIAGNIPDADAAVSALMNPASALLFHRGISHSLFLLIFLAPAVAYLLGRLAKDPRMGYSDWLWVTALPWLSHILVDIFNTYGTGVLEPFSSIRVSYDSVAIVDVFLWVIVLPPMAIAGFMGRPNAKRRLLACCSILFLTLYFGLSVIIKERLEATVRRELAGADRGNAPIHTAPLPLSNLVWLVVVDHGVAYGVEQRSVLNAHRPFLKRTLTKNAHLLDLEDCPDVRMIRRFTKGFHTVEQTEKGLTVYDVRYSSLAPGYPEAYAFAFNLTRGADGTLSMGRSHPKRSLTLENVRLYMGKADISIGCE